MNVIHFLFCVGCKKAYKQTLNSVMKISYSENLKTITFSQNVDKSFKKTVYCSKIFGGIKSGRYWIFLSGSRWQWVVVQFFWVIVGVCRSLWDFLGGSSLFGWFVGGSWWFWVAVAFFWVIMEGHEYLWGFCGWQFVVVGLFGTFSVVVGGCGSLWDFSGC